MTPEIERLRAEFKAADDVVTEAKRVAAEGLARLNDAVARWAIADLAARGIILGVTPVDGCSWNPREGQQPYYQRDHVAVVKVAAHNGQPRYLTQKLTKTGALSKAHGSRGDTYVAVRKAGEA